MTKIKALLDTINKKILRFVLKLRQISKNIKPIGFFGLSLWDVGYQFYKGVSQGAIGIRSSAIAFKFFLAIFPAIIFFFTLIPYIPIENFQENLMMLIGTIVPKASFSMIESTIHDIITNKRGSLLSFGVLGSLYFSTSGLATMIIAFNETINTFEKRSWIAVRITSIILALTIFVFATVAIVLITTSETVLGYLVSHNILQVGFTYYALIVGKWLIVISFFYFAIAMIYYLAPAKKSGFRFFSPGATLATLLGLLLTVGFSYYINNFSSYNKLYGSIGTLIIVLVWLRLNASIILIGFELNTSINSLKHNKIFIDSNMKSLK